MTDTTAGEGVVGWVSEWTGMYGKACRAFHYDEQGAADNAKWLEGRSFPVRLALAAQPSAGAQAVALWAMHIRGPDDLYPAPDYETAVKWCDYVNYSAAPRSPDVMMAAVPAIWPYEPERHRDGLAESVAGWTLPLNADGTEQVIKPLYATPAQPDTGDAAALREARLEALTLTRKYGDPNGPDYQQGVSDHGHRWVAQIDRILAALSKPNAPGVR